LRAAELERAAAEITAREERKRRRLAVGLAAAVLGFVLLGVGGWWWVSRQQSQREADTARVVNEAIQETTRLRGRAEAAPVGDVNPWKEALAVVKRAEDLLASGAATPELTEAVATLRTDVEAGLEKARQAAVAADLDRDMLGWLHAVREEATDMTEAGINHAAVEEAFAAAFQKYGLDVDNLSIAEAAQRIRGRPIQGELVAALDMWAWKRRCVGADEEGWERLFDVARAVEPDPWRDQLRNALAQNDGEELARLAKSADVAALPISVQVLLSDALIALGRIETGAFLRRAIQEHPRDYWINYYLGLVHNYHARPPNYREAIRYYTAALVANDRSAGLYAHLGYVLFTEETHLDEAIAAFEKAIRLNPAAGKTHINLGHAYAKKKLFDKAKDAYLKAIPLGPHNGIAYGSLGMLLQKEGRTDEAIAALEKSLAINDKEPAAHFYLALCFQNKDRWDDALTEYRKALACGAEPGSAHYNIGLILVNKNQLDDAIAAFKKASDLKFAPAYVQYANHLLARGRLDDALAAYPKALAAQPKNAKTYNNYGSALEKKNRLPEAIAAFERAFALQPTYTTALDNLRIVSRRQGKTLQQQERWDEAAAIYAKLLRHDPRDAQAHFELGSSYRNQGRFTDAIAAYQKALELKPASAATITPLIQSCAELLEWDKKLPAILRGDIKLSNPDRVPLTALCKIKKLYGLGARTYADMLRIAPELAEPVGAAFRYNAACAAALAAGGTGKDVPPLNEKERNEWRQKALDWLRADLGAWTKLAQAPEADIANVAANLSKWQKDASLMTVRDPTALAKLPESERAAWRQLWRDVAALAERLDKQSRRKENKSPAPP
jgi:eukaryotic-like serine/threonine-protein kinase